MTNKVEGFGDAIRRTSWTYYTSGSGRGQVKTELDQSGLLTEYAYDAEDRVVSVRRSGPGMMAETTTYGYEPVDPLDRRLPVDTRPRTVVKKLNNIECERTYFVYSPLTNIVERVGTQGAAYGSTNVLRTITAFYPAEEGNGGSVGGGHRTPRSGLVASIRHEDGRLDLYDYNLSSNLWTETVTHLHEQSPAPVSGKTTRDITLTNARGEEIEARTEAFIDRIWYAIAKNRMTYNAEGKRTSLENLAGQVTTTAWDCCHKVSETGPNGSTTTWDYDDEGRIIASSRLIPLDMTNVTWLTTTHAYDPHGRLVSTAADYEPTTEYTYDTLGNRIAKTSRTGGSPVQDEATFSWSYLPLKGGTAEFYKKSHWLVEDEIGVHVKICTDDRGETISGDLKQTARTFKHELIHARDMCRRGRGFECGEFTVEALNSGKFDKRICTELHAYSEENRHIYGLKPWEKKDVISRALKSVILACMKNGNEPDVKFSEELKKRAAKMYDECKQWGGK